MTLATFTGQSTMSFTQYVARLEITPGRTYAPFWSAFVHVLRNTMDHEAGESRGRSTIRVSTSVASDRFTVLVEDDSPGTDWDAVRTACESLGGSAQIELHKGEGSRVSFTFPNYNAVSQQHGTAPRRIGKRQTSAA
jgi:hypothetical protein